MIKKKEGKYSAIQKLWIAYFTVILVVILLFLGISIGIFGPMPSFAELENPKTNLATEVYSADGVLLGTYYIENRSNVQFQDLPDNLVKALIAIEDIRFEKHSGVDTKALIRVAFGLLSGNYKGGGSTLTQQLAKNLFPRDHDLSKLELVLRKFKEWVAAIKLERNYSKEEIIAMYLNTVPFGGNSYGIKMAAKTYFNKPPDSLTVEESAMLVAMLKGQTYYSPVRHPQRALERRNLVLEKMEKYDFLTRQEYDSISRLPIDLTNYGIQDHESGLATYFREILRLDLKEWCKNHKKTDGTNYDLYKDGLRVYTTIDSRLQKYAEEAVAEHVGKTLQPAFFRHWAGYHFAPFDFEVNPQEEIDKLMMMAARWSERYQAAKKAGIPEDSIMMQFNVRMPMKVFTWSGIKDTIMTPMDSIRYYKYFLQAGLMSVEPSTGHIKAYVGGINFKHFKYDHVRVAKRQVGSTFKPFLYTLAMQEGEFTPCSRVANVQYTVDLPTGEIWAPRNTAEDKVGEMVTLKWALANSNNWISAFLIKRYSPQSVIDMARKMGVTSDLEPVPSLALGSADISLYEMTGAFNTFANKGVHIEPIMITRIEDKYGNVLEEFIPERNEAMNEETAYLMLSLMKGVVESGTGIRLRFKYQFENPIAGKTGTTNNQSDGWFIGITPQLTTGIWVGAEDRSVHFRSLRLGQGANTALPIWAIYMQKVYADRSLGIYKGDFEKPLSGRVPELDCDYLETMDALERERLLEDEF